MPIIGVKMVHGKILYTLPSYEAVQYDFVIEDTVKHICYGTNDVMLVSHILSKIETKLG